MTAAEPCRAPTVTYLTLGDGDFTYSLDLAQYLQQQLWQDAGSSLPSFRLVATGLDTLEALHDKYRDAPFVLRSLRACESPRLSIEILHGVNAVAVAPSAGPPGPGPSAADRVVFNHPHLGTEDAARHARFLAHLFHACQTRWLAPGGRLHLTLAQGQGQRWGCLAAAEQQRLRLRDRATFRPPPPPAAGAGRTHYQARRHQTGRSFRNRTAGDSETLTFVRADEAGDGGGDGAAEVRLPWYDDPDTEPEAPRRVDAPDPSAAALAAGLACPYCEGKTFQEARSLKNHIHSKHAGGDDADGDGNDARPGKRRVAPSEVFTCALCSEPGRTFASEESLRAHVHAKHTGPHTTIRPDWSAAAATTAASTSDAPSRSGGGTTSADFGRCPVCDIAFGSEREAAEHDALFLPAPPVVTSTHACSLCGRDFRDRRARLQHENSCADSRRARAGRA